MSKEKKYQIFISSTYLDLIEERQTAVQTIVKMGHIPAGMELFKAGASQWQTITKWIDSSDIYLLILGGRYGTINIPEGKSYTHLEYEYALSTGMPVFALVLNETFLEEKNKNNDNIEIYEKENKKKYNEFKKLVQSKIVKFVEDTKDIQIEIQDNIRDIENNKKLEGWVRGGNTDNIIESLKENADLLKKNQKLIQENQKLKDKIQKLEATNTEKFSCGLTFEELKKTLKETQIKIPKEFNLKKEKTSLLVLFYSNGAQLASGVNNRAGISESMSFLYYSVASEILVYNLCDVKKAPGNASWSIITLNTEGKRFLAMLKNNLK